jgi:hypothetical protein
MVPRAGQRAPRTIVPGVEQGIVLSSSEPLGWEGLRVEAGWKHAWEATELALRFGVSPREARRRSH